MKKLFLFPILFFIVALTSSCGPNGNKNTDGATASTVDTTDTGSPAIFLVKPEADPRIGNRAFEQVPAIVTSEDGKNIYVAWYSGGPEAGPGNYITVAVSSDNGTTWLNNQFIAFPKETSTRLFDPALWRDKNGQVHLFYGSSKDNQLWDGRGGVNTIEINWDGTKIEHGDPIRLADGVMSNKPIYLAADNIELFSIYIDKPAETDSNANDYPENGTFILSHDYNTSETIDHLSPYSSIKVPDSIRIHDEPQLVQISDTGNLLALVRTTKGIYFSKSNDIGKTWTDVLPFTAIGPTTSSRFYIGKLKSGNILMIANNSTTRNKMTAFLSKDNGKTWPYKLLLDGRESVSYPDADQSADGSIHVVFDRDRSGAKDILYFRFNEDAIVNGNTENIVKARVNL